MANFLKIREGQLDGGDALIPLDGLMYSYGSSDTVTSQRYSTADSSVDSLYIVHTAETTRVVWANFIMTKAISCSTKGYTNSVIDITDDMPTGFSYIIIN
tara:strand:- start:33424 stop:33723 length:300 start_codon:yes stop_codon:yes gene_type:complete